MKILFMCVANSARSQLAEGLAKTIFPLAEIESAGSAPTQLNPYAVAVMQEIGIDISKARSKTCEDLAPTFLAQLDYVITLCAEEVCPILTTQATRLHWPHKDPASKTPLSSGEMLVRFREAREQIQAQLKKFRVELEV